MSIQEIYANYTRETSKEFLRNAEGSRARIIEERNTRFYMAVNEALNTKTVSKEEVLEV